MTTRINFQGKLWEFSLNTAKNVVYRTETAANVWSPYISLAGTAESQPAVAATASYIYVFVVGVNGAVYWKSWNGTSWTGTWGSLGGVFKQPYVISATAANSIVTVSGQGASDGQYYSKSYNEIAGAWSTAWTKMQTSPLGMAIPILIALVALSALSKRR